MARSLRQSGLPRVSFHALRHTHASMLIHNGVNVVKISRPLGHKNPTVTLKIYVHLFDKDDREAAEAAEAAMTTRLQPNSLCSEGSVGNSWTISVLFYGADLLSA